MTLSIPALNSTIQVKMDESFNNKTNDKAIEIVDILPRLKYVGFLGAIFVKKFSK